MKYYDESESVKDTQPKTCYKRLVDTAQEFNDLVALESLGMAFSYDAPLEEVDRVASAFFSLGVQAGDVVAIGDPKGTRMSGKVRALTPIIFHLGEG